MHAKITCARAALAAATAGPEIDRMLTAGGPAAGCQSSPENRSHAACLDTPRAAPMRVQLTPRDRKMAV